MLPEISEIIRRRKAANIKQYVLARAAGITPGYLAQLEKETRMSPAYTIVVNLLSALDRLERERAAGSDGKAA